MRNASFRSSTFANARTSGGRLTNHLRYGAIWSTTRIAFVEEPTRLARQEERLKMATARNERRAERLQAKLEEQARVQADAARAQAAADAAAEARIAAREKALNDRVSRVVKDEAARKAERDRRYADRKARQK